MTYEKAAKVLVDAGLMDDADVAAAVAALDSTSVEFTYSAWAEALVKAGLIEKANIEAATTVLENAGEKEEKDDPKAFEDGLMNAGIL
jgi:hypothetical protein